MDMIVRLLGQDSGYAATMNRASQSTWRVNASLDSMTSSMERQLGMSATTTRQTEILTLADRGAAGAKVDYALSLANQLDAVELLNASEAEQADRAAAAKAAAEQAAAAASRQADSELRLLQSLEQKNIELAQGALAAKRYEIATSGMSDEAKELALALLLESDALRKVNADEAQSAATVAANQKYVTDSIKTAERANATRGVSQIYLKLQEMAQRGATEAEIDAYYAAVQTTQKLDQAAAAYQRKTAAVQRSSTAMGGHSGASTRNLMAMQSLAFGIQDAAQVYGNTGLAGALSASANNLIFMTQMLNPQLALVTALAVAGAQFAAVLLPMAFNSKAAAKEAEAYNERLKEQIEYTKELAAAQREFLHALEDVQDRQSGQNLQQRTKREGQDLDSEIKTQIRLIDDLERKQAEQHEREMNFRANHQSLLGQGMETVGLSSVVGVGEQAGLEKELAAQRKGLAELEAKRRENMRQQPLADNAARNADIKQHEEESRQFAKEERERKQREDTELVGARWKAEREAHEKFVKDWKSLNEKTSQEAVDQDKVAKMKVMEELAQRQQQIATWLNEGRIDAYEAQRLTMNARQAAGRGLNEIDQKAAESARQEQLTQLEATARDQKTALDQQSQKAPDLNAVEARSSEGVKAVFDALGGGSDPQREIAKNTAEALRLQREQLQATLDEIAELKKLKPIKVG